MFALKDLEKEALLQTNKEAIQQLKDSLRKKKDCNEFEREKSIKLEEKYQLLLRVIYELILIFIINKMVLLLLL